MMVDELRNYRLDDASSALLLVTKTIGFRLLFHSEKDVGLTLTGQLKLLCKFAVYCDNRNGQSQEAYG